jgi:gamma-glutamylcyclotransferase
MFATTYNTAMLGLEELEVCWLTSVVFFFFADDTFAYFAYGSNLLSARIHLQNPTAAFQCIARLDNYRLEFDYDELPAWRGAVATITKSPGDHVWGVVWAIKTAALSNLDTQEGVDIGLYEVRGYITYI